jgi:hypothetical protein
MRFVGGDVIVTHAGRAKLWVLAGALLGALAGVAWFVTSAPYYQASAIIELSELPSTISLEPGSAPPRAVSIDTDAQIVAGDAVVDAVVEAVGADAATVRSSMTISARALTRVLVVTYTGPNADTARTGAGAAAEAFLAERERLLVAPVRAWLLDVAETQEQQATPVSDTSARTRIFPRPALDNRRLRAVEASLALPGPGRTLEASAEAPSAKRMQKELPLVSGTASGALAGLGVGLVRVRRGDGPQAGRSPRQANRR